MKLLKNNWVTSSYDEDQIQHIRDSAASGEAALNLLVEWAEREKAAIDSSMKAATIKDKPNRGELALMAFAQKEMLDKFISLLDNTDVEE